MFQASGGTVKVVRPTVIGNTAFFQAVCSPKDPTANQKTKAKGYDAVRCRVYLTARAATQVAALVV